jgi:large subunit ribosomal protein L5
MAATETAPPARLKLRYLDEIRPALMERFGYSSMMQAPHIEKITLNMGVGLARQDNKMLRAAIDQLATIAGQQPSVRRARKSIAAFKLREGMPVGVAVTLRGERGYEFLDRLISIAIPRIRDFRGLNPRSFDGRGNYSLGVREQIIFPEIDYDAIDQVRGLDITITTSATTDAEAFALLSALGLPFSSERRPRDFEESDAAAEADGDVAEAATGSEAASSEAAAEADDAGAAPVAEAVDVELEEPEAVEVEVEEPEAVEVEVEEPEAVEVDGEEPEAVEVEVEGSKPVEVEVEEPEAAPDASEPEAAESEPAAEAAELDSPPEATEPEASLGNGEPEATVPSAEPEAATPAAEAAPAAEADSPGSDAEQAQADESDTSEQEESH